MQWCACPKKCCKNPLAYFLKPLATDIKFYKIWGPLVNVVKIIFIILSLKLWQNKLERLFLTSLFSLIYVSVVTAHLRGSPFN